MECNKDEALRAKEIAEKKFTAKDIVGAKKFAMKAQSLYPGLEGISQMLVTFDVYLSAENKINGETDWYSVLSVNASADDETVKKQYRKLALALHPDKNKSVGADGAFKILSEAWSVLSDKGRRLTFDQKTKSGGHQKKTSQSNRSASASKSNGFRNTNNTSSSNVRSQSTNSFRPAPPPPPVSGPSSFCQPKSNSFWTECHRCKTQYEYPCVYLNHKLLCPNCREEFFAKELPNPRNGPHSTQFSSRQQKPSQNVSSKSGSVPMKYSTCVPSAGATHNNHGVGQDSFNKTSINCCPVYRSSGVASTTASAAAEAARVVHHTLEKVRKEGEEAQTSGKREEWSFQSSKRVFSSVSGSSNDNVFTIPEKLVKKRKTFDDNGGPDFAVDTTKDGLGTSKNLSDSERAYGFPQGRYCGITEFSLLERRNILLEKSKKAIVKKISEINLKKDKRKKRSGEVNAEKLVEDKPNTSLNEKKRDHIQHVSGDSDAKPASEEGEPGAISVPDPDFHDFDLDRVEGSFDENQVWAAYDDDDGMPRYYALIHQVLSLKPFKMQFSWLNSKSNSELGPLNWIASGFSKSCGEFRVGRYEVSNTVNVFSHKVRWEKGVRGVVKVFPTKADVWALYRNWSPDWNENTPDDVIHKYDMVEVLEGYSEEKGVLVAPLVKVAGFKTVFHRNMDPKKVKRIPREEMFRFSHQVPSCVLSFEEAPTVPKGCRELDPAATPLELLQVITETKGIVEAPSVIQGEENALERGEQKPKS